ncbi:MAG TPA: hypothetical protein VJ842_20285 [Pyrinomonadaceae bacterium]|nr:hypothetical protein [Pyrinomonadaceae bacterium]
MTNRLNLKSKFAAVFFATLLVAAGAFAAQKGLTKRVRFPRGRTTAVLKNSVVRGTVDRYLLGARSGQQMIVHISSVERNVVFKIYTPQGGRLEGMDEGEDSTDWSGTLPQDGDYIIEVGGTRGNATYTLEVSIRSEN